MALTPVAIPAAMQVPLLDLKPQYQPLAAEIQAAIEQVCASQHFILGPAGAGARGERRRLLPVPPRHRRLLRHRCAAARAHGARDRARAMRSSPARSPSSPPPAPSRAPARGRCSATSIRRPSTSSPAGGCRASRARSASGVRSELIHRGSGGRVRAIMPVHLYGQLADMAPLMDTARRYGLKVIEDAAQAIGAADAARHGVPAASATSAACRSFPPRTSAPSAMPACVSPTMPALAERMEILRVHGGKPKYYHALIGGNFRIDELQAAVLNVKLQHLDAWTRRTAAQRRLLRRAPSRARSSAARCRRRTRCAGRAAHLQSVRDARARARRACVSSWPRPASAPRSTTRCRCTCSSALPTSGTGAVTIPHSERAAAETLALPIYPELTETQLQYVVDIDRGLLPQLSVRRGRAGQRRGCWPIRLRGRQGER